MVVAALCCYRPHRDSVRFVGVSLRSRRGPFDDEHSEASSERHGGFPAAFVRETLFPLAMRSADTVDHLASYPPSGIRCCCDNGAYIIMRCTFGTLNRSFVCRRSTTFEAVRAYRLSKLAFKVSMLRGCRPTHGLVRLEALTFASVSLIHHSA